MRGVSTLANKIVVAKAHAAVPRPIHSLERGRGVTSAPLGQGDKTSNGKTSSADFRQFVYELLLRRKLPKQQAAHISRHAWREGTVKEKKSMFKLWTNFTKHNHLKRHDLRFDNLLKFLDYVRGWNKSYNTLRKARTFVSVTRKVIGQPLSQGNVFMLDKYMSPSFNANPPIKA